MPISEAKKRNNANYTAKCDYINLRPLKPEGAAIRAAAADAGMSLQGYILQAVRDRMQAEGRPLTVDLPPAQSVAENHDSKIVGKNEGDGSDTEASFHNGEQEE